MSHHVPSQIVSLVMSWPVALLTVKVLIAELSTVMLRPRSLGLVVVGGADVSVFLDCWVLMAELLEWKPWSAGMEKRGRLEYPELDVVDCCSSGRKKLEPC